MRLDIFGKDKGQPKPGDGVTFVTGSLFLVAEARAVIIGTKR